MSITFLYIFLVLLFLGVPVAFVLIFAPAVGMILTGKFQFLLLLPQRIFAGINQYPIVAVPLFMLAGEVMNSGKITATLVRFANDLVGHLRGGLAQVNILSSIIFAGLSGSAVADTSALGAIFFPAMKKEGYSDRFSAAVTSASSIIGPIIPPSLIMIIYAFVTEMDVGAMFAGGFIPGVLMGGALMVATSIIARKQNFPRRAERAPLSQIMRSFKDAFFPMLTPVIILGGILSGIFTPTEAAGVTVCYAITLTMFFSRTLPLKMLPELFLRAGTTASSVLLIVGGSVAFGYVSALSRLPHKFGELLVSLDYPKSIILLVVVIAILIVGMFLDAAPAILILGPILTPAMVNIGFDQLHFSVLMCVVITVGLITPPMGVVLFLAAAMTKTSVEKIAVELLPFLLTHIIVILLLAYIPALTLALPRLLGFW